MTKLKAAGIVLLSVIILASYFIYPHISISWLDANTASPKVAAFSETKLASLPSINPAGQGKVWVVQGCGSVVVTFTLTCMLQMGYPQKRVA